MKNKNFICILIFLAFVANISKSSELDITSKIIKVEEDGNKIIGENEVIIRTDNDVEIYSDYAEYFTPHSVAKIMATCLNTKKEKNVTCYDPASGSGTLLMNIANSCLLYTSPSPRDS